jgi:hypothetical protein
MSRFWAPPNAAIPRPLVQLAFWHVTIGRFPRDCEKEVTIAR